MLKVDIKSHPAVTVVGLKYRGKNENDEISQMWGRLGERRDEIQRLDVTVHAAFGVSIMDEDFKKTMIFEYIAGFPVTEIGLGQPEDMAAFTIPEGLYAVIICPNLGVIQEAFDTVYNHWLPESDYDLDLSEGNFNFERYGEEFIPEEGLEKFYIYIPVKGK